jgi:ribosome-associated protein
LRDNLQRMPKALKIKDKAIRQLVETVVDGMQDIKAKDITILDLTGLKNAVTDYFVIATGDSSTQVEGMASSVVRKTRKELRERPWHEEGVGNSEWILLDYVNVVVHIFYRETREFYNLEDLWADANRTDIPNLQ